MGAGARERGRPGMDRLERPRPLPARDGRAHPVAAPAGAPRAAGHRVRSLRGDLLPAVAGGGVQFGQLPPRRRRGAERAPSPRPPRAGPHRAVRGLSPRPRPESARVAMPVIESRIDRESEAFQRNRQRTLALIARLRALEARTREESAKAKPLFDRRGQLLPRERVARLLDVGAPWLELCSLAGYCLDD